MTLDTHRLPIDAFDQLAAGGGDAAAVTRLRAGQLSKRMLLIRGVVTQARDDEPEAWDRAGVPAVVQALTAAQSVHRASVDDLLLRPDVGIEAMAGLRRLQEPAPDRRPDEALAFLGPLAVAATLLAGLDADLRVRATEGMFMVPAFGLVSVPAGTAWLPVRVRGADRTLRVVLPAGVPPAVVAIVPGEPGLRELRHVRAGHDGVRVDVTLDDVSPSRARFDLPIADRLGEPDLHAWRRRFAEGWRELVDLDRPRARAMAAGLTTIFPLRATPSIPELSASTADGFGAVAATRPATATACAGTLVHEFQHGKLSALLDLVPILAETGAGLFYAPWRADPRPLGGLLQGAYAYLGLVDFWDRKRHADGGLYAHFEFARWREEVHVVLAILREHGRLTPMGTRFLDIMAATVERYRSAPVPAEALEPALTAVAESWTSWQLRNCAPPDDVVERWADAWHRGVEPPARESLRCVARPGERGIADSGRMMLTRRRLRGQGGAAVPDAEVDDRDRPLADRLFVSGDLTDAAGRYKALIRCDPADVDAWTGLVMCRRGAPDRAGVLVREPAAVRAVYARSAAVYGDAADPDDLARWMS